MATDRKNYIDEKGNYHNVENLSLADIYQHGFYEGKKACYYKGHVPEADRWISVKERLPDDLEPVNITWINHDPEPYYKEIKGKPFTASGVYFNGQWYWWSKLCTNILAEYSHNFDDVIDDGIEIIAWRPLPKPYESEAK